MKYLFLGLAVLTLALVGALVAVLLSENKNKSSGSASITGGIDVDNARRGVAEFDSPYNNLDTMIDGGSVCMKSGGIRLRLFIEERSSKNRFSAVVSTGDVVIGRLVDGCPGINNISVSRSTNVSRRHCRVFLCGGEMYISNLSNTTVTRLNEIPVNNPMPLHVGDVITVGDVQLSVIAIQ